MWRSRHRLYAAAAAAAPPPPPPTVLLLPLLSSSQGKHEEALGAHRKALEIRLKVLGPEHPDVAASYNNLGTINGRQGKQEVSLGAHRKALGLGQRISLGFSQRSVGLLMMACEHASTLIF